MRKNIFDDNIIMINTSEIIFLKEHTNDSNLKKFYSSFIHNLLNNADSKRKKGENKYTTFGIDIYKTDVYSKRIIDDLNMRSFDNPCEYIYFDDLVNAYFDFAYETEINNKLKSIWENNFNGLKFALRKVDLLKTNDEGIIDFLLAYQDTNKNIDKDKKILLYENCNLVSEYNVDNKKLLQKKRDL